jgi:hypothetical protein
MARTAALVLLLAACGGPSNKPPTTIGNSGDPPPPAPEPSPVGGVITDEMGQPAVGATVVLVGEQLVGEQVTLTNEQGQYGFAAIPPGTYDLLLYYADLTYKRRFEVAGPTTLNQSIRLNAAGTGEVIVCTGDSVTTCK